MSLLRSLIFGGSTYHALTGERRKAFVHQWVISAVILLSLAAAALVIVARGRYGGATPEPQQSQIERSLFLATLLLLGLQFLYALVRKETIWQPRLREWRNNAAKSDANKAELLDFAAKLQQEREK